MVCAIAGTGELGFNRDGLPPQESDFYLLSAVRRGPDGLLYLMDFNNMRLRRIEAGGEAMSTIVGNGFHALADVTLPAVDSPLENPIDFDFLPDGRIVFVSYHDPRVIALDMDGTLEVLAGTGDVGLRGNEGDFEDPLTAQFIQLDGIAVAPDGAIYVSDSLANRVRKIADGTIVTVAGNGREGYAGDGGPGEMAELHWPTALTFDHDGSLLIAESLSHAVRRLAVDGTISTIAGDGTQGDDGDGGPATAAHLNAPNGVTVGPDGTIYIADRNNFRVRAIAPDGTIDTIAGTGEQGHSGDGGDARSATFGFLARVALDDGSLLVADQSNSCARRVILAPR